MSKRHDIGGRPGHLPGEVVELAVVFVAAGAVHLLTSAAGHAAYGPALLMVIGVILVVGMMVGRRLRARRRAAGETAEQPPAWPYATPVCVACGAAQETVVLRLDSTGTGPPGGDSADMPGGR